VRVIAGEAKGRLLVAVPGSGTRPITARVKESLFNILGPDVRGARFLDLFGGTGAVGIEALSRGASEAVFIEKAHRAVGTIRRNLEATGLAERARVLQMDAFRYIQQADPTDPFDYVYVAPPQYRDLWAATLLALNEKPLLAEEGLVIVQVHPKEYHALSTPNLSLVDERHYGSTALYFYERSAEAPAAAGEEV
jgi:16S rRNA (guanine(966)-N(2))-methyltransferase RsmD